MQEQKMKIELKFYAVVFLPLIKDMKKQIQIVLKVQPKMKGD